jgi:hypothetical protein
MNNKIKELAEQSGLIPGIMGLNRFTYFDPEKFAELIVKECITITNEQYFAYEAVEALQKHFGGEK